MMLKCDNCGHLFEDGEQAVWEERHGLDTPPYEKWDGCPLCRGSYEQVYQCKECGEWHTEYEVFNGWCEKCLRDTVSYSTFFDYCEAYKKHGHLDSFVMMYFFDMDAPKNPSEDFHELMVKVYWEKTKEFDFINDCFAFIEEDYREYADWLNKREVKTNA